MKFTITLMNAELLGGEEVSRYIDADNVIAQLKEYIDEYSWVDEKCDWCTSCPSCDNYYGCLRDERNRRLCDYYEPRFNYCPNCGAKMEVL